MRGRDAAPDEWVADPSITWRILLSADLAGAPEEYDVRKALTALHAAQGWSGAATLIRGDDVDTLRLELGEAPGTALAVGLAGRTVVVSAHHSRVDGLGLLAVLAALTDAPMTSAARGVADRPNGAGLIGTVARRLLEVAATPPARIITTPPTTANRGTGDVYVTADVAGVHRTAELVHAATRAVLTHNGTRRTRHVAIAVGVSRAGGTEAHIADHSALLRLRDVERLDLADIRTALSTTPTQHTSHHTDQHTGQDRRWGGTVLRLGLRTLAPRLGSTLLVSHLGTVTAPGVEHLAFHPVTAGGTGISLGAVTLAGSTTLTLRARGRTWTHDGLEQLLEAVTRELRGEQ